MGYFIVMKPLRRLISVVETPAYLRKAERVLSEEQRTEIVNVIANSPDIGDLIRGSGGVRKVRVSLAGRGKSGGARIVYFYHNDRIPVFLLTLFAKKEKENLTKAEVNQLKSLTTEIKRRAGP